MESSVSPKKTYQLGLELFCLSFISLFLELMVIRWAPSVIRCIAYYTNLMLISSFLGLGMGAMLSKSKRQWFLWFPVLLVVYIGFLLLLQYATLPGSRAEMRFYASAPQVLNYISLLGVFAMNALVFIPLGQRIGRLFDSFPPLLAYTWDLGGSLFGTLTFGLFSFAYFSPTWGFIFLGVLFLVLMPIRHWIWAIVIFMVTAFGVHQTNDPASIWSPYYYLTVREKKGDSKYQDVRTPALREAHPDLKTMQNPPSYLVSVNHDFYQPNITLDKKRYTDPQLLQQIEINRIAYDLPYLVAPSHKRVLVMGSGGGTDVEAALLNGAEEVDAVEIDPGLVKISHQFHAADVYKNPKVKVHIDDGRSFLHKAKPGYDMVVFGWLDSQALASYMSNLRLDGYIYTVESMQSAFRLLDDQGVLAVSFMAGWPWLMKKIVAMVAEATGQMPLIYANEKRQIIVCASRAAFVKPPYQHGHFERAFLTPEEIFKDSTPPTDDWPFLYLRDKTIPLDYLVIMGLLLLLSLVAIVSLRGRGFGKNDFHFMFLGLGFLLLETRSISDCCLYFGNTWFVTMVIVAGVLIMVLASNLTAMVLRKFSFWLYLPLLVSLIVLYFVPRQSILSLDFFGRVCWAIFAVPLPVFFAGLIFSTTFRESANPSALFGANLIGAMIGGFLEYLTMVLGSQNLLLLIVAAYLASLLCQSRKLAK